MDDSKETKPGHVKITYETVEKNGSSGRGYGCLYLIIIILSIIFQCCPTKYICQHGYTLKITDTGLNCVLEKQPDYDRFIGSYIDESGKLVTRNVYVAGFGAVGLGFSYRENTAFTYLQSVIACDTL